MPNNCWNYITIAADAKELDILMTEEFKDIENKEQFTLNNRGIEAVSFRIWSAWHPNFEWLESLLVKYPSSWVKDIWMVEDGQAGVWIGSANNKEGKTIRQFLWDDMSVEEDNHRFQAKPKV